MPRGKSFQVNVKPDVLEWAVNSSGWPHEKLAKRMKITGTTLTKWLNGEKKPTIKQLETLSAVVKRPLASFFLPEPPKEKPIPRDYRMLPDRDGKFDKKTILSIRRARRLQKLSRELSDNVHTGLLADTLKATLRNNPKAFAQKYLGIFNITNETKKQWKDSYKRFNYLRDVIESKNVMVFQMSMPVEDARGFALADEPPFIIVINSKDSIEARIFSLLHEFGHILLEESGISLSEKTLRMNNLNDVEKWCNEFASEFLLPEKEAKELFSRYEDSLTDTETLNSLSRKCKLSKAMLLYNMSKFGFISNSNYRSVLGRWQDESQIEKGAKTKDKSKKSSGFGLSGEKKCFNEKGNKFVSLVANNVERGFITHSDALNYLSIKSKNLEKVMSRAKND